MTLELPPALLERVVGRIHEEAGWLLPPSRSRELERWAAREARTHGEGDAPACLEALLQCPGHDGGMERLIQDLAIGETFFFRDRSVFRALERIVLPELILARTTGARALSIWCAGCATGEEPYSVAAILDELLPDRTGWLATVLATDVSRRFLETARQGRYGKHSFRSLKEEIRGRYFQVAGYETWDVDPRIRKLVSFMLHNLVRDLFPLGLDVILCRNVLMYFAHETAERVVGAFCQSLAPGGWLIVSPAEASLLRNSSLCPVTVEGAILHRKPVGTVAVAKQAEPPAPPPVRAPRRTVPTARGPAGARPVTARSLHEEARAHADKGELDAARTLCLAAIEGDRLDPCLYYLLASVLEAQGDLEAALDSLRRALYLDQDFAMAHVATGIIARKLGRRGTASRHLRIALSLAGRLGPGDVIPEAEGMSPVGLVGLVGAILSGGL